MLGRLVAHELRRELLLLVGILRALSLIVVVGTQYSILILVLALGLRSRSGDAGPPDCFRAPGFAHPLHGHARAHFWCLGLDDTDLDLLSRFHRVK